MLQRLLLYSALAAAICAVVVFQSRLQRQETQRAAAASISRPHRPFVPRTGPQLQPQPDARFLVAVGDVHHLLTGREAGQADATFAEGVWQLRFGPDEVGVLPEFPDFDDCMGVLTAWSTRLGARTSLVGTPGRAAQAAITARLRDLHAIEAADLADRRWGAGERSPALVRSAAHALVLLTAESADQVGASDRVAARALALTAMSAALDSAGAARDACLLAELMGYSGSAFRQSEGLSPADPVRQFVRQEDDALAALSAHPSSSRETRFIRLLRLARRSDLPGWEDVLDRDFNQDPALALPLVCTGLLLGRFETQAPAGASVLAGIVYDLGLLGQPVAAVPEAELTYGPLVVEFEQMMDAMLPSADGAFLDRDLLRGYYRGCFYSALEAIGEHLRTSLASIPATRDFAQALADVPEGPAREFARCYSHLANLMAGKSDLAALRADLAQVPHFGTGLRLHTYREIRDRSAYGDFGARAAARALAERLDTRPEDLVLFVSLLDREMLDLVRTEEVADRISAILGPTRVGYQAWWAGYRDDRAGLEALLASPGLEPAQVREILRFYQEVAAADTPAVRAAYERAIATHPDEWDLSNQYVKYLEERPKDYATARSVVQNWLNLDVPTTGLEEVIARSALARMYYLEGRYAEGLAAVQPVVESQQFGAMNRAARLLEKLGRGGAAETLAVFAYQRYPDSPHAQALLVETLWRHGHPDVAGQLIARSPFPISADVWESELIPALREIYAGRRGDMRRAIRFATGAGTSTRTRMLLANALGHAGDSELAFEIASGIREGGQDRIAVMMRAYDHLKRWRGAFAAGVWLKSRMLFDGDTEKSIAGFVGLTNQDYEVVWVVAPSPSSEHGEFQWLMRAVAQLLSGGGSEGHRADLARHYAEPSDDYYREIGRYLLGIVPLEKVLAVVHGSKSNCEVDYYVGLKAQAEGRYRDAADWYQRCIETGQVNNGELRLAYEQLYLWMAKGESLDRLAAHEHQGAPLTATASR